MSSFFEKACTCHKMVKEMHIPYEAFLGGVTCVPQVWVSTAVFPYWMGGHVTVSFFNYSQLSRKQPPLVNDKVVAYRRWSSMGKIKKKTQTELINIIT